MRRIVFGGVLYLMIATTPCFAEQTDAVATFGHYMGCVDGAARVNLRGGASLEDSVKEAENVCVDLLAAFRLDLVASFKVQLTAAQFEAQKQTIEGEFDRVVADRKVAASDAVKEMLSDYRERLQPGGQAQQAADAAVKAAESAISGQ